MFIEAVNSDSVIIHVSFCTEEKFRHSETFTIVSVQLTHFFVPCEESSAACYHFHLDILVCGWEQHVICELTGCSATPKLQNQEVSHHPRSHLEFCFLYEHSAGLD